MNLIKPAIIKTKPTGVLATIYRSALPLPKRLALMDYIDGLAPEKRVLLDMFMNLRPDVLVRTQILIEEIEKAVLAGDLKKLNRLMTVYNLR